MALSRKSVASATAAAPRGRGRPPSIDPEQLLAVARDVFLERGIRATAQEVAARAGVSEGAVFHRFKTKEALFRAAMQLQADDMPALLFSAVEAVEGLELRDALLKLANALLEIGKIGIPLMMMTWSNPDQHLPTPCDTNRAKFRQVLKRLAVYFESQIQQGKLRNMDAEVLARVFLGSIHHYCMTQILAGDQEPGIIPEGMFARGLVDLMLQGALSPTHLSSI